MKILLDCHVPFLLAHGGAQIQIEQTRAALEKIGVDVDYLRWWDDSQKADIIHHFGRFSGPLIHLAHDKGIKVVMADLLTAQGSRSRGRIRAQRWISRFLKLALPGIAPRAFGWESYILADACIALTAHEAWIMTYQFDAPPEKVHVVPNGVEDVSSKANLFRAATGSSAPPPSPNASASSNWPRPPSTRKHPSGSSAAPIPTPTRTPRASLTSPNAIRI